MGKTVKLIVIFWYSTRHHTAAMAKSDSSIGRAEKVTIAVEGNIGSGKTTLLKYLKDTDQAHVVDEPVEKWRHVTPGADGNLMELMYKNPMRYAYLFQSYVLLTMMEAHEEEHISNGPYKVMERSVYSARYCFIENLRKMTPPLINELEYAVSTQWFDYLIKHRRPQVDLIVYIRTSPAICLSRLQKRNHSEEVGVSLAYLQSLHELHEDWLIHNTTQHGGNVPVLVLNGDTDSADYEKIPIEFCKAIADKIMQIQSATVSPSSCLPDPSAMAGVTSNASLQVLH